MTRGSLWTALEEEVATEFGELSSIAFHDFEAPGGLAAVRNDLPRYLAGSRSWLIADHYEAAEQYRGIRASKRLDWAERLLGQVGRLLPLPRAHCKRGHDIIDEDNVITKRDGRRTCKVCHRELARERLRSENMRIKLPKERDGVIQRFTVHSPEPCLACAEHGCAACSSTGQVVRKVKGYVTASLYPRVFTFKGLHDDDAEDARAAGLVEGVPHPRAGKLAEVFIKIGKAGESTAQFDEWAVRFSKALQRGENLNELCAEHRYNTYLPAGAVTGVRGIKRCTSILDLVCHWIQLRWCGLVETKQVPDDVKDVVEILTTPDLALKMPMRHIAGYDAQPVCGAVTFAAEALVEAALESDCDECRGKLNVGPMAQRGCGLRQAPSYEPRAIIPGERDKT